MGKGLEVGRSKRFFCRKRGFGIWGREGRCLVRVLGRKVLNLLGRFGVFKSYC